eukprot:scaffold126923_cov60-Phaeocystis_antarctica.AAC.1
MRSSLGSPTSGPKPPSLSTGSPSDLHLTGRSTGAADASCDCSCTDDAPASTPRKSATASRAGLIATAHSTRKP